MNINPSSAPTALIVHAHPEPKSFNTAQARTSQQTLEAQGFHVEMIDLYARKWNPVLDRSEFPPIDGPFKPQHEQQNAVINNGLAPEVRTDLDALLRADLLILSFPLWWFSMPAILKGWIDRVFVMGATFGGRYGIYEQASLAGHRAVILTTTGGSAESFEPTGTFGDTDNFLFHIHRGMLEFVGYDVLQPIITYGPAHLNDTDRAIALKKVEAAFKNINIRDAASRLTQQHRL